MDAFFVKSPGALTAIQDLGRIGYGQYGIPVSGAMDRFSFVAANVLVGNDPGNAGLEITLCRLKLEILRTVRVAITGGDMTPMLDSYPVSMWRTLELPAGSTLLFKNIHRGARAYLAVEGGVDAPLVLGGRSTHQKALIGKPLQKGEIIRTLPAQRPASFWRLPQAWIPIILEETEIRVLMGPQDDYFTPKGLGTFLKETYTITTESDRQGYRLQGPPIEHVSEADIISDPILPGAIQVPGNGQPIIMMTDGQTTGGYTKIACVTRPDIDLLAQMLPGAKVRFKRISIEEAHRNLHAYTEAISSLGKALIPW
jgi:antagonist of KipI